MTNRFLMLAKLEEGLSQYFCEQYRATEIVLRTITNFWGLVVSEEEQELIKKANISLQNSLLLSFFSPDPEKTRFARLSYVGMYPLWYNFWCPIEAPTLDEFSRTLPMVELGVVSTNYTIYAIDMSGYLSVASFKRHGFHGVYRCLILAEFEYALGKKYGDDAGFTLIKRMLATRTRKKYDGLSYAGVLYAYYDLSAKPQEQVEQLRLYGDERVAYVSQNSISGVWLDGVEYRLNFKPALSMKDLSNDASYRFVAVGKKRMFYRLDFYRVHF